MRKHLQQSNRHTAPPLTERGPWTRQSYLPLGYPAFDNNFNWPMTFNINAKSCKRENHDI
jgi:hypothetical protein